MKRALPLLTTVAVASACTPSLQGDNRLAFDRYTRVEAVVSTERDAVELPLAPTVEDYVRVAIARNPKIARARREAVAAGYSIARATGLPDPMLMVTPPTGDLTETAAGRIDSAVGISQRIPFPTKLVARGAIASKDAAVAHEAYRTAELEVRADVLRAYYMLYFADRAVALTERSRGLLRDFRNIALRKYETGNVPQQDVLRSQVELANLEKDLVRLRQARDTATASVNRLLSYPVDRPVPVTRAIRPERLNLEREELARIAEASNPDIVAARRRIERAEAGLDLARLDSLPDLTFEYRRTQVSSSGLSPVANGDDSGRLNVGITLPIWLDRLNAGRREAEARLDASREALTDVRDTTGFRIEEAVLKVDAEQRLVALFGEVIIPEARQTLDASVSAYRAGTVDFLTFVQNWRRLLDFEIAYEKSLSALERELAELERLVGRPFAAIERATEEPS